MNDDNYEICRALQLLQLCLNFAPARIARPSCEKQTQSRSDQALLSVHWLEKPLRVAGTTVTGIYDEGVLTAGPDGPLPLRHEEVNSGTAARVLSQLKRKLRRGDGLYTPDGFDVHSATRSQLITVCQVNGINCFNPGGQPMMFRSRMTVAYGSGSNIKTATLRPCTPWNHEDWLEKDGDLRCAIIAHMNARWRIHHFGKRYNRLFEGWSNKETAQIFNLITNCSDCYRAISHRLSQGVSIGTGFVRDLFRRTGETLDPDYYDDVEINWGEIADNLACHYR